MATSPEAHAYDYAQVDVFAERPLEGNPLAVFADGRGLSTQQMQSIARETNLSETAFILPRAPEVERTSGVRVRIFTTQEELPFAGHPTLGTASWLYWNHPIFRGADEITLDLAVGPIPVRFPTRKDDRHGAFGVMRQRDPDFGEPDHDCARMASLLGFAADDLDSSLPIQMVTTGNPFCIVPLRSVEALGRLALPRTAELRSYLDNCGAKFFYFLTQATNSSADWRARMQFYTGEDPATGSAAGPAIAYLVHHHRVDSGETTILEQGIEIGRPSRLHVSAKSVDGSVTDVCVGGRTIPVAMGRFFLS
ncbi:MAG: PhzF family phenazine biosynthesis protein [Acidobacteriaceae bacterium]|nr:PhzF family phenazine biosynthesis protein [Acidobacteriaceae bacterium]